jgi:hypothetical protein
MFFTINTSPLKRMLLTNAPTVRELIITTGRNLRPPVARPPAKQHGRPAIKQEARNPMWMLVAGLGD